MCVVIEDEAKKMLSELELKCDELDSLVIERCRSAETVTDPSVKHVVVQLAQWNLNRLHALGQEITSKLLDFES